MPETAADLDDLKLLLKLLRALRGWGQAELAEAAGVDPSSIQRYETGRARPLRKTVQRLVAAVGLPMAFVEACLLPALRSARALIVAEGEETTEDPCDLPNDLDQTLLAAARAAIAASVGSEQPRFLEPWPRQTAPVPEDRLAAEDAWERLRSCTGRERLFLVEKAPEFRTWAVAERLCHASVHAAGDSADRAIELAELGVHVAALSGGEENWRSSLEGYALGFFANALRVRNHFEKAEETFGEAWTRWVSGKQTGLLQIWRLYSLEGSLRGSLHQSAEALESLDRAFQAAPLEQRGRILLSKASVLEQAGEVETAITALGEAKTFPEIMSEPRLRFVLLYLLAVCMCRLARYEEASFVVREVRHRATHLENELDSIRATWLEAGLAIGFGSLLEARDKLESVCQELESRGLDTECALAKKELEAVRGQIEAGSIEAESADSFTDMTHFGRWASWRTKLRHSNSKGN